MLIPPRNWSLFFCPSMNLCIPENSWATGNAFGFGEEIQVPNTVHTTCPFSHTGLLSGLGTLGGCPVPSKLFCGRLLLHLDSGVPSERPSLLLPLPAPCVLGASLWFVVQGVHGFFYLPE